MSDDRASAASRAARGPRSDLARYAFGWSDRKPWGSLIILGVMTLIMAVAALTGNWPAFNDDAAPPGQVTEGER